MRRIEFELTDDEAAVAGARAAWRLSLAGGLLARHFAPLAAFVLAVAFAAILGASGLIAHRSAEIAVIASAAAYMAYRLWTRRRFFSARRAANAWADSLRGAGLVYVTLDEAGYRQTAPGLEKTYGFSDGLEAETVAGLVYVWPRAGLPLVWPSRAHSDAADAAAFLAAVERRPAAPPLADDDD